jgi:hypothetical protein
MSQVRRPLSSFRPQQSKSSNTVVKALSTQADFQRMSALDPLQTFISSQADCQAVRSC